MLAAVAYDVTGDGYARYEDAEAVATQMIDVNGDGVVDADDLSAILDAGSDAGRTRPYEEMGVVPLRA